MPAAGKSLASPSTPLATAVSLFRVPQVAKEWQCPLRSNSFVLPFTCLVLFAYLVEAESDGAKTFAKVLFWMGAPTGLLLSFIKVRAECVALGMTRMDGG